MKKALLAVALTTLAFQAHAAEYDVGDEFPYILPASIQANYAAAESAYVREDYRTAYEHLVPLAAAGDLEANYLLGEMHDLGEAFPADHAVALGFYLRAAGGGHANAAFTLGYKYEHGLGVAKDLAQAAKWYRESALGMSAQILAYIDAVR
jgi:TPR repeat protein